MNETELIEVVNKARLVYLSIWIGLTAICFGLGAILSPSVAPENGVLLAFFVIGAFGGLLLASYVAFALLFFGFFGGWRWLARKTVPKEPPAWYQTPTLRQALFRESFISLGILILILILIVIRNLVRG